MQRDTYNLSYFIQSEKFRINELNRLKNSQCKRYVPKHRGDKINLTDLAHLYIPSPLPLPFETSPISDANVFASTKGVTVRIREWNVTKISSWKFGLINLAEHVVDNRETPPSSRARINLNRRNCSCAWVGNSKGLSVALNVNYQPL